MDNNNTYDMDNKSTYETLDKLFSVVPFRKAENEHSLKDIFQTREQQKRDGYITQLLSFYVGAYDKKVGFVTEYRKRIVEVLITTLAVIVCLVSIVTVVALSNPIVSLEHVIGLVSTIVSFSALIIGLIKTIVEYVFPKDDEKYITTIVRAIQKNDLENKRVNIDAKFGRKQDEKKEKDID